MRIGNAHRLEHATLVWHALAERKLSLKLAQLLAVVVLLNSIPLERIGQPLDRATYASSLRHIAASRQPRTDNPRHFRASGRVECEEGEDATDCLVDLVG